MIYPETLERTIDYLKKLPGIGEKTAERMALAIMEELNEKEINDFSEVLKASKKFLHPCKICGHITDREVCSICCDENRKQNLICVVEDYKSVFVFEKTGNYTGVYHVLNGLISPADGINIEDINIQSLISRINNYRGEIELIIALKPTVAGDATTLYLKKIFEKTGVKVSRLSYGIPMGAEIDYIDTMTLARALQDRKQISE